MAEFVKNEFDDIVSANVVAIDITKQKMAEVDLKRKEEMIFSELERKISRWKTEITQRTSFEETQLRTVDAKITAITKQEVLND